MKVVRSGFLIAILALFALATQALAGGGPISVDYTRVIEVFTRNNTNNLLYGKQGITITNRAEPDAASGYSVWDHEPTPGQGFRETSGGMSPGTKTTIFTYINPQRRFNGVYAGKSTIRYQRDGKYNDGAVVEYILLLTGPHPPMTPPTMEEASRAVGVVLQQAPNEPHAYYAHGGLPADTTIRCPEGYVCSIAENTGYLVVQTGPTTVKGSGVIARWIPDMDYYQFAECNVFSAEAALAARSQPPYRATIRSKAAYYSDCSGVVGRTP